MEPRIQHVQTEDGGSIAHWTMGESVRWVVLVPPLGRGGRDFDDLGLALARAGFRVLAFDPRGARAASHPPMVRSTK